MLEGQTEMLYSLPYLHIKIKAHLKVQKNSEYTIYCIRDMFNIIDFTAEVVHIDALKCSN